ncbi:MAG: DinB family protein [Acidobacteria bacterium]|nr:MAG: DinB family protein [Acidobacteriota bacterium]
MEIRDIQSFLTYYENLRRRTMKVVACIPPEKIEWAYMPDKFTFGDILRHVAAIERYMYAENAQLKPSRYPGHGEDLAVGYDATLQFFNRAHEESMAIFASLTDADLQKECLTPADAPIRVWKWLRTLAEHEIHHRGQLYVYLGVLGIAGPPLYGLTSEQVLERSLPIVGEQLDADAGYQGISAGQGKA